MVILKNDDVKKINLILKKFSCESWLINDDDIQATSNGAGDSEIFMLYLDEIKSWLEDIFSDVDVKLDRSNIDENGEFSVSVTIKLKSCSTEL